MAWSERGAGGRPPSRQETLWFAIVAALGLLTRLLPGPGTDWGVFALAVALNLVIVGLALWRPARWYVVAPFVYLLAVVLLRQSSHGVSGDTVLALLAVIWLAMFCTRAELMLGLIALAAALLIPYMIYGAPRYPPYALRTTVILVGVSALAGLTIQSLLGRVRASRDQLMGLLSAATETVIYATDAATGAIKQFNEGAERLLGYRAEEVIGKPALTLLHDPEEVARAASQLGTTPRESLVGEASRGGSSTGEWTLIRKDGGRVRLSLTITPERDDDGRIYGFLGIGVDLTQRIRVESELQAERDFSQTVIDSAPSLVMVLDSRGRIERYNRACEQLTGLLERDVIGRFYWDAVLPEPDRAAARIELENAPAQAFPFSAEREWETSAGGRGLIAFSATAIAGPDGAIEHLICTGPISPNCAVQRRARHHAAVAVDGDPRKVGIRGQHEPRDPHAPERGDRDVGCPARTAP